MNIIDSYLKDPAANKEAAISIIFNTITKQIRREIYVIIVKIAILVAIALTMTLCVVLIDAFRGDTITQIILIITLSIIISLLIYLGYWLYIFVYLLHQNTDDFHKLVPNNHYYIHKFENKCIVNIIRAELIIHQV